MTATIDLRPNRKYPNIPSITDDPASHRDALLAVIEALNIGQRRTSDILNSFIRVSDLVDIGLIDLNSSTNASTTPATPAAHTHALATEITDEGALAYLNTVGTAQIDNNAVDNSKGSDMAQQTLKGRAVGAGTGDPTDLTATQAAAIIATVADPFTVYVKKASDTMTGTLNTRALIPTLTRTYDLGTNALLYNDVRAKRLLLRDLSATGTRVVNVGPADQHIIAAFGTGGTEHFELDSTPNFGFSTASTYADSAGSTSRINNTGGYVFGRAITYASFTGTTATLGTNSNADCFVQGQVYCGGNVATANTFELSANGNSAFAAGLVGADALEGVTAYMRSSGNGSFTAGTIGPSLSGTVAGMEAAGPGAMAHGFVSRGVMTAPGDGAFVNGYCAASNNTAGFLASGRGCFISGSVEGSGSISAIDKGAVALGATTAASSGSITASGLGAVAVAYLIGAISCVASAANSVQFGPGTNTQADSLKVGVSGSGIAIKGTTGPFTSTSNGQVYVGGTGNVFTTIRSNGKAVQLNCGNATGFTLGTFTSDFALTDTTTVTLKETADVLATLITELRTANLIN